MGYRDALGLIALLLIAACTGPVPAGPISALPSPTIAPPTTALPSPAVAPTAAALSPTAALPSPAVAPTATVPLPTTIPLIDIELPELPQPAPSNALAQLPAVWLVVDNSAVLGSPGGYGYTIDLGGGQTNPVVADAGPPQENPNLASLQLPAGGQALIVVGEPGLADVADVRAIMLPWAPTGQSDPLFNELLAPLFDQPREDVRTFELPPIADGGERLLGISLTFAGELHQNDYATYYWRLLP